jgi:hypothetical protein
MITFAVGMLVGAAVTICAYHFHVVANLKAERDALRAEVHSLYKALSSFSK